MRISCGAPKSRRVGAQISEIEQDPFAPNPQGHLDAEQFHKDDPRLAPVDLPQFPPNQPPRPYSQSSPGARAGYRHSVGRWSAYDPFLRNLFERLPFSTKAASADR